MKRILPIAASCALILFSQARAADPAVVFNEIQYHPADELNQTEWIELRSLHAVDVDLSGWQLKGSPTYTFPEGTILPGRGYLVIAAQPGQIPGALGPWTGSLKNSGEFVSLVNRAGRVMDEIDYADSGDWPGGADGTGATLSRRNQLAATEGPSAWTTSNELGGTPGGSNFADAESAPTQSLVVPVDATWKYNDANVAPDSSWKTAAYDDSAWASGPGILYAGTGKLTQPIAPTLIEPGVGLYGWWAFEDNLANNAAGGATGTAVGTDFAYVTDPAFAGKTGKALKININGSNVAVGTTHIAAGNLPALTQSSNFTWSFWARTAIPAGTQIIVGNRFNSTGGEFSPREFLKFTNNSQEWHVNNAGQDNDINPDLSGTVAAPSAWTHFVSVKTGTTLALYRNGNLVASRTISATPANAQPFFMGGNRSGAGTAEGWAGYLDDVALWTRALPAQSVTGLYNGTYTPATAPTAITVPSGILPPAVKFPQVTSTPLTDDFAGASLDAGKWTVENLGLETTANGNYNAPTTSGGQLTLGGTTTVNYWAGKSIKSVARFSTRSKQVVTVDRNSISVTGDATAIGRSSIWLYADANHYLHFSHNLNEGGWSYNSRDIGGTGTNNPVGGGVNLAALDAFDADKGKCEMKLVYEPSTFLGYGTIYMYRDGMLAGSQSVTNWPADFAVVLTGQARKATDTVSVVFDNLAVQQTATLTLQTPMTLGASTYYFRKSFNYDGEPSRTALAMFPALDDGAVFYLNGQEIYRQNMPVGTPSHGTFASSTVVDALFPQTSVSIPTTALVKGANVLSVELHQDGAASPDALFGAQMTATETPLPPIDQTPTLVFSEIATSLDADWKIEIANLSGSLINLTGYQVRCAGGSYSLTGSLAAGGRLVLDAATLGLLHPNNAVISLVGPDGRSLLDAKKITNTLRGRTENGVWGYPNAATFGSANTFTIRNEIVINEIMRKAPADSPEQWIEIYNKSGAAVDLAGWQFTDGIDFTFPSDASSVLGAGQYAVIVWDVAAFNALHPSVAKVFGPFSGSLKSNEAIKLRDVSGNVADELHYYDSGSWPAFASGSASTYELKNPNADNAIGEAWAASNETSNGVWQTVSYDFSGANLENNPTYYGEFITGLLNDGEVLIDDIHVIQDPLGTPVELIQPNNGDFSTGVANKWRFEGNHRRSVLMDDPDTPGNKVLKIVSGGYTEHMSNHCSTSLKNGSDPLPFQLDSTKTYRITFRARWWKGNNALHTRLYLNRGARTTLLTMPTTGGTPGAQNSTFVANHGPTFSGLSHAPAVPAAGATAVVSIKPQDPDGLAAVNLFYSVNEAAPQTIAMTLGANGVYSATIPAQAASAKANFYVQATDTLGASATYPANAMAGRAIIPWNDSQALLTLPSGAKPHNVRIVMTASDTTLLHALNNVMSNDWMPCTMIYDEREIYYGVKTRLKGSEHGRAKAVRAGFFLLFPSDRLFLGMSESVAIDRSGAGDQFSQKEILVKHTMNHAGMRATEDDLIRVIAPQSAQTGPAIFVKTKLDSDNWLDGSFDQGGDGTMFEYELIYPLYSTSPAAMTDDGTFEGHKLTQDGPGPTGIPVRAIQSGTPLVNSTNKEDYRQHWLIKNNRTKDDYTRLVPAVTALGLSGDAFLTNTAPLIDTNEWLKAFAGPVAWGIGDNYAFNSQHNMIMYFRPTDGKAIYLPWDMDFTANVGTGSSIVPNTELQKMIGVIPPTSPANIAIAAANKRAYYNYLLSICNTSFNTNYQTRWAQHYSTFLNEDLTSFLSYVSAREASVRAQVAAGIPYVGFQITTATGGVPGADFSTANPSVALAGDGWINVSSLRVNGVPVGSITWTDQDSWQLSVPVYVGANVYVVEGFDAQNNRVGTDSITVTGTGSIVPADATNTALSELMYHPLLGNLEFIELVNVTNNTIDLSASYFSEGITYTFPPGSQMLPGGRFVLQEGTYTGNLRNSGETITLMTANGSVIFSASYPDQPTSTDGGGRSLVRVLASTNPNLATYVWRQSTNDGGSPGTSDAVAFVGTPSADADSDGCSALLEYYFGTSDNDASSRPSPLTYPIANDGTFQMTIDRLAGADDAYLEMKFSTDLQDWNDPYFGQSVFQEAVGTPIGGGMERITIGPITYAETGPRYFWRAELNKR